MQLDEMHPIDPSKQCVSEYHRIFPSIPMNIIALVQDAMANEPYIPHTEAVIERASIAILEAMWAREVTYMQHIPMRDVVKWVNFHGESVLARYGMTIASVNLQYVLTHVQSYEFAAHRLRRQTFGVTEKNVMGDTYTHPKLMIQFYAPLRIGNVAYVSSIECTSDDHHMPFQYIAQCFDGRKRCLIQHQVHAHGPAEFYIAFGHEAGQRKWSIAYALALAANIKIQNLSIVFDLEWNNITPNNRYTSGTIVDAHFEDLDTEWVIYSGMVRVPYKIQLSQFLIRHNYSVEAINTHGKRFDFMKRCITDTQSVADDAIFIAYNGANSDIHILYNSGIYIQHFLDASVVLCGGRIVSLAQLYAEEFGTKFLAHNAASDTIALLKIMRKRRITFNALKRLYMQLREFGACVYIPSVN